MSILSLIKIEELKVEGLSKTTTMLSDSAFYCQKKTKDDSLSSGGYPTIENYIKRMLIVSDNYSYSKLYEFVGHDYAHQKLRNLNYNNIRLFNRLDAQCPGDTAKITPPVYFLDKNKDTLYKQPLTYYHEKLSHPIKNSKVGRAHTNNGKRIKAPKDFSNHNYLHITDLHSLIKRLIFNNYDTAALSINEENRKFLIKQMGLYPRESEYPVFTKKVFYDSFKKYFLYASAVASIDQDSIRVINIVGRAYGFLIDCAYIVDFKNKTEFFLTASVYVNDRNIIGSGKYEYDQLGLPYLRDLSKLIYTYDYNRKRKIEPDLSEIEMLFKKLD